jgi:hypothetical protein
MNEGEKTAFRRFYALRWWERDGGFEGDVTAAEIQVSACLHQLMFSMAPCLGRLFASLATSHTRHQPNHPITTHS